jgi:catechol 2,3-dioxygenase
MSTLPETLALGAVHLSVANLTRSIDFYQEALGLSLHSNGNGTAEIGDGETALVVLHEEPDARAPGEHAGLYHYCLRYGTREELGRALLRLQQAGWPVRNVRDRGTHEALYLSDPDGTNVELAWDRPREAWPADPYGHTPRSIDPELLLEPIAGEPVPARVAAGVAVGHIHFTIGGIDDAVNFYRDRLGFDLRYHVGRAAFFSVGGYHHQVGANIYGGEGLDPLPAGLLGLRHWTLVVPGDAVEAARSRFASACEGIAVIDGGFAVSDPWRIPLHVVAENH